MALNEVSREDVQWQSFCLSQNLTLHHVQVGHLLGCNPTLLQIFFQNALNWPKWNFLYIRNFTDFVSSVLKDKFHHIFMCFACFFCFERQVPSYFHVFCLFLLFWKTSSIIFSCFLLVSSVLKDKFHHIFMCFACWWRYQAFSIFNRGYTVLKLWTLLNTCVLPIIY